MPGGRPPVLDETKRREIIAMLALGGSRRMAAKFAGCSPMTIARTAERDPEFAAAMDRAQQTSQIEALRRIRKAAYDPRYWRAAAWTLERLNPDDFAPRPPRLLTHEFVAQLLVTASAPFVERMSHEDYDQFMQRLAVLAGREPIPTDAEIARLRGSRSSAEHFIYSFDTESPDDDPDPSPDSDMLLESDEVDSYATPSGDCPDFCEHEHQPNVASEAWFARGETVAGEDGPVPIAPDSTPSSAQGFDTNCTEQPLDPVLASTTQIIMAPNLASPSIDSTQPDP